MVTGVTPASLHKYEPLKQKLGPTRDIFQIVQVKRYPQGTCSVCGGSWSKKREISKMYSVARFAEKDTAFMQGFVEFTIPENTML